MPKLHPNPRRWLPRLMWGGATVTIIEPGYPDGEGWFVCFAWFGFQVELQGVRIQRRFR